MPRVGVKRSRLYELIRAYQARPLTSSLLASSAGTQTGSRRLPDEIEAVVSEAIDQFFKSPQKPSINALHNEVRRRWSCAAAGFDDPDAAAARETCAALGYGMTVSVRLPVAPRPFRNELLSSWMVRVAACYGLEVPEMTTWLAGQGTGLQSPRFIDDIAPDPNVLKLWARACRIDPARLTRLSLALRYPDHADVWTLDRSDAPVCLACFDEDRARGHDSYLRSAWRLAEHLVCPIHGQMLHDRCRACNAQLRVSFQFWSGVLRPFCSRCGSLLASRAGEPEDIPDAGFAAGVLDLQRQVEHILKVNHDHRLRLAHAIRTLWAPLDRVDAARPTLALWFDQPGWHCPFEARAAVSTDTPFQHLSLRWRALTLIILGDLFGAALEFEPEMPETARWLFSRAAPVHLRQWWRSDEEKRSVDWVPGRVQRLNKSPVHRLSENFLDERRDFERSHP